MIQRYSAGNDTEIQCNDTGIQCNDTEIQCNVLWCYNVIMDMGVDRTDKLMIPAAWQTRFLSHISQFEQNGMLLNNARHVKCIVYSASNLPLI